jgi:hypothetical protein
MRSSSFCTSIGSELDWTSAIVEEGIGGARAALELQRTVPVGQRLRPDRDLQVHAAQRFWRVAGRAGDGAQMARRIGQPLLVWLGGVAVAGHADVLRSVLDGGRCDLVRPVTIAAAGRRDKALAQPDRVGAGFIGLEHPVVAGAAGIVLRERILTGIVDALDVARVAGQLQLRMAPGATDRPVHGSREGGAIHRE